MIEEIAKQEGDIQIALGHSMGGVALALANHLSQKFNPAKLIEMGAPNKLQTVFDVYASVLGLNQNIQREMRKVVEKLTNLSFDQVKLENLLNSNETFKTMLVHDELDKVVPFKRAQEIMDNANVTKVFSTFGLGHVRILRDQDVIHEVLEFIQFG